MVTCMDFSVNVSKDEKHRTAEAKFSVFYENSIHTDSDVKMIIRDNMENLLNGDISGFPKSILVVSEEYAPKISDFLTVIVCALGSDGS